MRITSRNGAETRKEDGRCDLDEAIMISCKSGALWEIEWSDVLFKIEIELHTSAGSRMSSNFGPLMREDPEDRALYKISLIGNLLF